MDGARLIIKSILKSRTQIVLPMIMWINEQKIMMMIRRSKNFMTHQNIIFIVSTAFEFKEKENDSTYHLASFCKTVHFILLVNLHF